MASHEARTRRTADKADRFKLLREARRNRTRADLYEDDHEEDLYDEVDEHEYNATQDDEAFVEDDDNAGYVNNGYEEEPTLSDEYDENHDAGKRKRKGKSKKGKKEEATPKSGASINKFFQKSAQAAIDRKPKPTPATSAQADDFMASLLSNLEADEVKEPETLLPRGKVRRTADTPIHRPNRGIERSHAVFDDPLDQPLAMTRMNDTVKTAVENTGAQNTTMETKDTASTFNGDDNYDDGWDPDMADAVMDMDHLSTVVKQEKIEDHVVNDLQIRPAVAVKKEPVPLKPAAPRPDLQSWEAAEASMVSSTTFASDAVKEEAQQSLDVLEKDGSLRMWWYDAYERREKGCVYLFGKVMSKSLQKYVSCCVTVKNIERNVFVLPRPAHLDRNGNPTDEEVSMADVYGELSDICTRQGIRKWASKSVTRNYAFEIPGVPAESEYLKMVYSYEDPSLPSELQGATFSHVFGANTGPLEHFLIKRDIMGPCWLQVADATISNANETWCKTEVVAENPKMCNPYRDEQSGQASTQAPPLSVMSISLRTVMNPNKNINEIVAASAVVCNQVQMDHPTPIEAQPKTRFAVIRQLSDAPFPAGFSQCVTNERQQNGLTVQTERTEMALLNYLIARIHAYDPDVIVGHNFAGFDLDVLLHRMKALNTQNWHRLGRLRRRNWPKLQQGAGGAGESTYQERMIMSGRLVCDTYLASKDLIRSKSYRLTDLAQSQLKIAREDLAFEKLPTYYETAESLIHLVKHCSFDAFLSAALMFKLQVLPLTRQLTNLAGNLWSRTMTGARAERNEFLLLHEFHRQKFICPDKSFGAKPQAAVIEAVELDQDEDADQVQSRKKTKSTRRKPAYTGGLVLEPKKGFYDKYVLLLDFNSLYPSIIQEYNVCFTTVQRHDAPADDHEGQEDGLDKVPNIPDKALPQGVLPRLIKTLVDRRRQVKKLMKDPKLSEAEIMQYDIRQKALKLTANSMYGCLGFSHSRFYAKPLAMLITHKGREILQNTVDLAGSIDLNVIYGDTDSIMVYTNENDIAKVKEIGNQLKKRVNELYSLLEIDIDGLFKHMLLLKKKKYAALLVEEKPNGELVETVETKGLDLVRRDWCDLSHDLSSQVLKFILSEQDREDVVNEIHAYLRTVGEQIRQGEMSLDKYIINKQLTKNPEDYADAKNQPHVQVAMRMREAGISARAGDTIPYVICQVEHVPNGSKSGFAERAYHPDDVKRGVMHLDIEWYLNQQVHPPIARLCSPIDGTDAARIAECLGLDATKYNTGVRGSDEQDEFMTLESQISDEERFKESEKLLIKCSHCGKENVYDGIARVVEDGKVECGLECNGCRQVLHTASIQTQLNLVIRSFIRRYYAGWLVCDDRTCENRTRKMSVFGHRCLNDGCRGYMLREYSDKKLYTQLLYFTYLFDAAKAKSKAANTPSAPQVEEMTNRHQKTLAALKQVASLYLQRSGYSYVDLSKLMAGVHY